MSAQDIATAGGFTSRQVVADRLVGRTPITLDDIGQIANALALDPVVLLGSAEDMMRWVAEHPAPAAVETPVAETPAPTKHPRKRARRASK